MNTLAMSKIIGLCKIIKISFVESSKAWERPGTSLREKPKTEMPGDRLSAAYASGGVAGESKILRKYSIG
jgi:hypothetical protein